MAKRYRAAEVCRLLDLQPYVLRYWATEFPSLTMPADGAGSQATYGEEDLAQLRRIKRLLYEEGYTIAGARKKLESEPLAPEPAASAPLFEESGEDGEESAAKPAPARRRSARAAAATVAESDDSNAIDLDTSDDERIETLRRGVADALSEARELLARLERGR